MFQNMINRAVINQVKFKYILTSVRQLFHRQTLRIIDFNWVNNKLS